MIIDAHARLSRGTSARDLVAVMDRCGIDRAVLSAGSVIPEERLARQLATGEWSTDSADNASVLRAAREHPDRVVAFWFGNPHGGVAAYAAATEEFRGLELSPAVHGSPLSHPGVAALLDVAQSRGHVVYVVCVPRGGVSVEDLVLEARRRPTITFVLGHGGMGPLDIGGVRLVAPVPNIFVETSCTLFRTIEVALAELGPERILFGSEYPHQHPAAELAKIRALAIDQVTLDTVLGGAACRLLGLSPPTTDSIQHLEVAAT